MLPAQTIIENPSTPIVDVRSPAEFAKGHVPGAVNIPILSDIDRHVVGLTYKKDGREEAIKQGLALVGARMKDLVEELDAKIEGKKVIVYCWRGGMRSESFTWLANLYGYNANAIKGGYKAWRRLIHQRFKEPINLVVLGGYTGCDKTKILGLLKVRGEQVIDLEGIANHKGSAFGSMGTQPSTEHFENMLAWQLFKMNDDQPIWVEDESQSIGSVYLPHEFKRQMIDSPLVLVRRRLLERINSLCDEYGKCDPTYLAKGFEKIETRLGHHQHLKAQSSLKEGDLFAACEIALKYYDKSYQHALERSERTPAHTVDLSGKSAGLIAGKLYEWRRKNLRSIAMDQGVVAK